MSCRADKVERFRGDTYPILLVVTKDGAAYDVTNCTFVLSISKDSSPASADYLFQSTGTIVDAVNGKVQFPVTDINADNVGNFYFDVQMIDAGGYKRTVSKGPITFTQDVGKD